ncbi:MAG: thioredoxin-dependent thiol peroxidase [Alphaproteobacteria bacterium]|nr:thioredoxin-dependent thiol peroxidase [Alphaproteobacteria bacterium]
MPVAKKLAQKTAPKPVAKSSPKPLKKTAAKPAARSKPVKKSVSLKIGDKVPALTLTTLEGDINLAKLKGQNVVLYFYPKDDTPGCTKQACGFQDNLPKFKKTNATIIGVSKDNLVSHQKFAKKYKLAFNLAADADVSAANAFGVWVEKSMYGRKYMGMDRATFLIDSKGVIRAIWNNVKVPGHVEEVMKASQKLKK